MAHPTCHCLRLTAILERGSQVALRKKISGFTIIEALIALLVMAVGLLGVAALQVQSKRANMHAVQRTLASVQANDILERMRNNATRLSDYITTVGGQTVSSEPSPACTDSNSCTPPQLAAHDLWVWEQVIDGAGELNDGDFTGGLVLPTACVAGPGGGGSGIYTVTIVWRGHNAITDTNPNNCGQASGKYDDNPGGVSPSAFNCFLHRCRLDPSTRVSFVNAALRWWS